MSSSAPDNLARNTGLHVFFSGNVQGVGFRYRALTVAQKFPVTGWVRNRSDGRVEMMAEGSEESLEQFLAALAHEMSEHIDKVERVWQPATGEWARFEIGPSY